MAIFSQRSLFKTCLLSVKTTIWKHKKEIPYIVAHIVKRLTSKEIELANRVQILDEVDGV